MIARSQALMSRLGVPIVTCVIGEGGSGGALAIAVGAGALLAGSRSDVKAAAATVGATKGASNRIRPCAAIGTGSENGSANSLSGTPRTTFENSSPSATDSATPRPLQPVQP